MYWRRKTTRFGGWLALAALAIQMVASFGHVHLPRVHHAGPANANVATAQSAQSGTPQQPDQDTDDYCAICASIYLISSTFLPQAPQLPVPSVWQSIHDAVLVAILATVPHRTAFRSRAPPLA